MMFGMPRNFNTDIFQSQAPKMSMGGLGSRIGSALSPMGQSPQAPVMGMPNQGMGGSFLHNFYQNMMNPGGMKQHVMPQSQFTPQSPITQPQQISHPYQIPTGTDIFSGRSPMQGGMMQPNAGGIDTSRFRTFGSTGNSKGRTVSGGY